MSSSGGGGGGGGAYQTSEASSISLPSLQRLTREAEDEETGRREEWEERSVFAAAISAFSSLKQSMEGKLVEEILAVARANLLKYKAEK